MAGKCNTDDKKRLSIDTLIDRGVDFSAFQDNVFQKSRGRLRIFVFSANSDDRFLGHGSDRNQADQEAVPRGH